MTESLLARAKTILGCSEPELAELLGMSAHTVAAYCKGARIEYLNAGQLERLRRILADYATGVQCAVDEFDLLT